MKDPLCPHCQTSASEHEYSYERQIGECLNWWIALDFPPRKDVFLKFIYDGEDAWWAYTKMDSDNLHAPETRAFTDWQHAGPLLEEMYPAMWMPNVVNVIDNVKIWEILFEQKEGRPYHVTAFDPTLVICRAYLIWKANQTCNSDS